jgi:hypothetical protein
VTAVVVFFSVTISGYGALYVLVVVVVVSRRDIPEEHAARPGNISTMTNRILVIEILLFWCASYK